MPRRRTVLAAGLIAISLPVLSAPAIGLASCHPWPAWEAFAATFVAGSGRLIDPSATDGRTTSEGQAYALFFSLVANDRSRFEQILRWTEDNLAEGNLSARLPAWLWGKRTANDWRVIDANPAADADLWIAYVLQEAGRLWQAPHYTRLGQQVADRILREETVVLDGLGRLMLPAPQGFAREAGGALFNPSYVPLQVLRRLATGSTSDSARTQWAEQQATTLRLILDSAPRGFVPDWSVYSVAGGFVGATSNEAATGSFNAIRTYLWAGMLAPDTPGRAALLRGLRPMAAATVKAGVPPERVDVRSAVLQGSGDLGFSAALLPLIDALYGPRAAAVQRERIRAGDPFSRSDNYYEQALTMFGLGWADRHYRFAPDGMLQVRWTCSAR